MDTHRRLLAAALPAYDIGDEVGRGAFGVVYAATHRTLGRRVAVKALPQAFVADAALRQRFEREARTVASFDHPHIVAVHDYVEAEGLSAFVMEFLPGGTLWHRFSTEGLSHPDACAAAIAIAAALDYAHARGVLHRDVKPENLMYSAEGVVKLTDFGIAHLATIDNRLTVDGTALGTPAYMAPEQVLGEPLGPASDVYSTAAMLYELLSGALPYDAPTDSLAALVRRYETAPVPLRVRAPGVPEGVASVVHRGLARSASDRYGTAAEFGVALAEAATEAFGAGWLSRGGVPVRALPQAVAVTERPSGTLGPAAGGPEAPSPRPPAAPTEAVVVARPRRRRLLVAGAVAAGVAAAVAVAFVAAGGDGGDTATQAASTTTAADATTTASGGPTTGAIDYDAWMVACTPLAETSLSSADAAQERCDCLYTTVSRSVADRQEYLDAVGASGPVGPRLRAAIAACEAAGR